MYALNEDLENSSNCTSVASLKDPLSTSLGISGEYHLPTTYLEQRSLKLSVAEPLMISKVRQGRAGFPILLELTQ